MRIEAATTISLRTSKQQGRVSIRMKGATTILLVLCGILSFCTLSFSQPQEEKMRVAVVEFDEKGDVGIKDVGSIVAELMVTSLGKIGRWEMVERVLLRDILEEQGLGLTGVIDQETAAEIGKVYGVKRLIVGSVMKLGTSIIITARLIDTANAQILRTAEVETTTVEKIRAKTADLASLLVKAYGTLVVNSIPSEAEVYLDGVYTGTTPARLEEVAKGEHRLVLKKESYAEKIDSIRIREEETTEIEVRLEKLQGGNIRIESTPTDARVHLDGVYRGESPLTLDNIPPGIHEVGLEKEGHKDYRETVTVERRRTVIVKATLTKSSPIAAALSESRGAVVYKKDAYSTVSEYERITGKKIRRFNEAPTIRELVARGELLTVESRLPKEPLVLLPRTADGVIGRYGGVLRCASSSVFNNSPEIELPGLISALYAFPINVYSSMDQPYRGTKGGIEWVFHLRRGVRWSDGVPLTTEDVIFWYEDIALNKEYTPTLPYSLQQKSGDPAKCVKIDDYTFKLIFDDPPLIMGNIYDLAASAASWPKHYLKQFHPEYQEKYQLNRRVKEAGFNSWVELMASKYSWAKQESNTEKPVLTPWVCVQGHPAKTLIYERNPYYFAVDGEGSQLPYLDEVHIDIVSDEEVAIQRARTGEVDFFALLADSDTYPSLTDRIRTYGKMKVTRWNPANINVAQLEFNPASKDVLLNRIVQDIRFRMAVSYAIDREMINRIVFDGMLTPRQSSWSRSSPSYENWAKSATHYDPEKAAVLLLDEMGLDARDAEGYRRRPDGKRLSLSALTYASTGVEEIVIENLRDVGIYASLEIVEERLMTKRLRANNTEAIFRVNSPWTGEGIYQVKDALGSLTPSSYWGPLWLQWGNRPNEEEVRQRRNPEILELVEIQRQLGETVDLEKRREYIRKITDIATDSVWVIGTLSPLGFLIAHNPNLQNIPTDYLIWFREDFGRPMLWFYAE